MFQVYCSLFKHKHTLPLKRLLNRFFALAADACESCDSIVCSNLLVHVSSNGLHLDPCNWMLTLLRLQDADPHFLPFHSSSSSSSSSSIIFRASLLFSSSSSSLFLPLPPPPLSSPTSVYFAHLRPPHSSFPLPFFPELFSTTPSSKVKRERCGLLCSFFQ